MSASSRRRISFKTPALQALVIQVFSFLLLLLLFKCARSISDLRISLGVAALLQGCIAAAISRWRKLASWWVLIELLFPIVVLATQALHLPPSLFLFIFIFLLGLYWSTFRTQVPFYPSGKTAWAAVAGLLPQERPIQCIDIGSGLGGFVLDLAKRRPDSYFVGIELAPLPWMISQARRWISGSRARFIRGDYEDLTLAQYDVVFAYLSPAAMAALWNKAQVEMRPASLLLSYEFPIVGIIPQISIIDASGGPTLYGWYI
jgi:hypothetical protein